MPDHTSSQDTLARPDPPALSFRQLLLRAAVEESRAPRFLMSLFDAPEGEHDVPLDAIPLATSDDDIFWQTPSVASLQVEDRNGTRWAHLVCGLRMTEEADMIYFTATLDDRGLRASYRPDEGEPRGDEAAFSEIGLTGMIPPETVSEFIEELELPGMQTA